MSAIKRVQQWSTFARVWHVFDAKWQNPFDSAKLINYYLTGKHKPIYHPMNDCGDHVVVINSKDVALAGDEWKKKVYFHHTGYPGGASWTLAWELHQKDPAMILKKACYRYLEGNLQRRYTMCRLHIYPDEQVPDKIMKNVSNQIRQLRLPPKTLTDYSEEERKAFPKIIDYPKDYVYR